MYGLLKLASSQRRRDEVPNQELARQLVASRDLASIREIAKNLSNPDRAVQSDCIKVLYEIGYLEPDLVAGHVEDFIKLLKSRNNRLVWGAMIALGTVASLKPDVLFAHYADIKRAMALGSVITADNGIAALARVVEARPDYSDEISPYLLDHLKSCRPKDVPQRAEKTLPAVNPSNKAAFMAVLEKRTEDLLGSGLARVRRVLKRAASI